MFEVMIRVEAQLKLVAKVAGGLRGAAAPPTMLEEELVAKCTK